MNIKKIIDTNFRVMMYTLPIVSVILIVVFAVKLCNPSIDKNKIIPINEKFNHLSESNIEKIDIVFLSRSTRVPNYSIIISNKNVIYDFKNCLKSSKKIERSIARNENRYRITVHFKDKTIYQFYFEYKLRS